MNILRLKTFRLHIIIFIIYNLLLYYIIIQYYILLYNNIIIIKIHSPQVVLNIFYSALVRPYFSNYIKARLATHQKVIDKTAIIIYLFETKHV